MRGYMTKIKFWLVINKVFVLDLQSRRRKKVDTSSFVTENLSIFPEALLELYYQYLVCIYRPSLMLISR